MIYIADNICFFIFSTKKVAGISQETVYSKILWGEDKFSKNSETDRLYYMNYIEKYAQLGADICLLEYTRDYNLIKEIKKYCLERGFKYYVSDSIELD